MSRTTRVIAEVGSTHMSNKDLIKSGTEYLADAGVDAIKYQLFPNDPKYTASGNVWLHPDMFYYAVEIAHGVGIDISASVFDEDSLDILLASDPTWVKFAYSRKEDLVNIRGVIASGLEAIVSCDVMTVDAVPSRATRLFCIPSYPVYFEPRFDEIFPRFDGFSDHTLGFDVTLTAVRMGAHTIEKHVKLADSGCPDCAFALSLKDFAAMTRAIKRIDPLEALEPTVGEFEK